MLRALTGLAVLLVFLAAFGESRSFVSGTLVSIPEGATLREAAHLLSEEHVASAPLIRLWVMLQFGSDDIKAGEYLFETAQGPLIIARRLISGDFRIEHVPVLIPEGTTVRDIGRILATALTDFDEDTFRALAEGKEGYLFPDTYFFLPRTTAQEAFDTLSRTFDEKTRPLLAGKSEEEVRDILIMASLLEEEAQTPEDKRLVSGILWERLSIGMPLQVDAPFVYILGKGSAELTLEDLALESPFNTYRFKGLPPTPISNPGLESIEAALVPTKSEYLFYLSGDDGVLHYAETHEEHVVNKAKFIH